jgi:hypothetical protein
VPAKVFEQVGLDRVDRLYLFPMVPHPREDVLNAILGKVLVSADLDAVLKKHLVVLLLQIHHGLIIPCFKFFPYLSILHPVEFDFTDPLNYGSHSLSLWRDWIEVKNRELQKVE